MPAGQHSNRYAIGLALSGGGFRGMAHIGVLRAMERLHLRPDFIAGTSAGSLVGALYASGKSSDEIESLAGNIFWPSLLAPHGLADFCRRYLPATFSLLALPLSVVVTGLPAKEPVVFDSGDLLPAITASCAMPWLFRRVRIGDRMYTDGGWGCVLPAVVCREHGCKSVISSDVWWRASVARKAGFSLDSRFAETVFSRQYMEAVRHSDHLIHPRIPALGIVPGRLGMRSLVRSGVIAAEKALTASSLSS